MSASLRAALLLLWTASASVSFAQTPPEPAHQPKLGVVIVVDQMVPDYLTRFDSLYVGGFRRLIDNGALFLGAIHDHAATETAVGHTTISTGCLPSRHGVIGNNYYDRNAQREVYSMRDTLSPLIGKPIGSGSSPARILEPTLGDHLKTHSPASKVFAFALKDRSAIGMGGKMADGAYWFDWKTGNYVTSTYYADSYPAWIDSFSAARQVDSYYDSGWHKLLPEAAYAISNPDNSPNENDGIHTTFPHLFTDHSPQQDTTYWDELYATPFADEVTISLARTAVKTQQLGADNTVDLLWIGCSAADATGHTYGPLSQEIQDFYLRLDRYLGDLFTSLDSLVGRDKYVVVLSSDHGVLPLPEDLQKLGIDAGRIHPDTVRAALKRIGEKVASEQGLASNPIKDGIGDIILDYSVMTGRNEKALQDAVAAEIRRLPYVKDVFGRDELLNPSTPHRTYLQKFRNCITPDRGPDLMVLFRQFYLIDNNAFGTSHGTPYDYDCTVPIVFAGPGVVSGVHEEIIRTIDIAPTLAMLLGIQIDHPMDGSVLKNILTRE
ncbi:MAG: alkaline phosphatase family protein [bacterium]|nr:alkaline phosphatase family protein [bacterium]